MYCLYCGKELPDGSLFCSACGEEQPAAPAGRAVPGPERETGQAVRRSPGAGKREAEPGKGRKALIAVVLALCLLAVGLGGVVLGRALAGRSDAGAPVPSPTPQDAGGVTLNPLPTSLPSGQPIVTPSPLPGTNNPQPGTNTPQPGTNNPQPGTTTPPPGTTAPPPGTTTPPPATATPRPDAATPPPTAEPVSPPVPGTPAYTPRRTEKLWLDHMEIFRLGGFEIEYPVFGGDYCDLVNDLVYEWAVSLCYPGYSPLGSDYDDFSEDSYGTYRCAVTLLNEEILSLVFWGEGYFDGAAHTFFDVVPMNLDLNTCQLFRLGDIFAMDDAEFREIVCALGRYPEWPGTSPSGKADFDDIMAMVVAEHRDYYLHDGYLTTEGPVFSFEVGMIAADHFDVLVYGEALSEYYNSIDIAWYRLFDG